MRIQKRFRLVLLCICMMILLAGCSSSTGKIVTENKTGQAVTEAVQNVSEISKEDGAGEENGTASELDEVMAVDTTASTIKFYNIKKAKQETYAYNDGTYFLDKYGEYTSLSKMVPGKIVQIELSDRTKELKKVQISEDAWEYDDVKKFSVDEEDSIITIAGKKYYYGSSLNVFSNEDIIKLGDIGNKDVLRIQGIGREIFTVSVTSGHGVIQLTNTGLFEGGWLSLGSKIYLQVTKDMQIEISEGTYLLTVANDGYGDSKEITVTRGEETTVDLNELKGAGPQYCTINFEVGVANAVMTIDGEIVDYSQPQQVEYGIHKLEIVADGYDTWSKRLYVNSKEATIQVAMTEESTETDTIAQSSSESSATKSTTSTTGTSATTASSTSESSEATDSYLSTLSDIINTLTDSSSDSD